MGPMAADEGPPRAPLPRGRSQREAPPRSAPALGTSEKQWQGAVFWADAWAAGAAARGRGREEIAEAETATATATAEEASPEAEKVTASAAGVTAAETTAATAEAEALLWAATLAAVRARVASAKGLVEARRVAEARAELEAAALELQVEQAAAAMLRERKSQIAAWEADADGKHCAIEALQAEVAAEEAKLEASLKELAILRQQLGGKEGHGALFDVRRQLKTSEAEEKKLLATVEDLERDFEALPELERQRLWWWERMTQLECAANEYRRKLEPLDRKCESLEGQRQADERLHEEMQRRLEALEAAYGLVGVDVESVRCRDGSLDRVDLSLAICLAVMPPRSLDFASGRESAPYTGEGPRRSDAGKGPPLLPSRPPVRRSSSHSPRSPSHAAAVAAARRWEEAALAATQDLQTPSTHGPMLRRAPPLIGAGLWPPGTGSPLMPSPVISPWGHNIPWMESGGYG